MAGTACPANRLPRVRSWWTCAGCVRSRSIRNGDVARAGGGALWEDVDGATVPHSLFVPGGTFVDTGIGGLTLTGGIGFLMGTGGLTCDNLVEATVVTADGSVVTASADGDSDLLWALRGGGGNFGVVTEFAFRLHPLREIHVGAYAVRLADAAVGLRRWRRSSARRRPSCCS